MVCCTIWVLLTLCKNVAPFPGLRPPERHRKNSVSRTRDLNVSPPPRITITSHSDQNRQRERCHQGCYMHLPKLPPAATHFQVGQQGRLELHISLRPEQTILFSIDNCSGSAHTAAYAATGRAMRRARVENRMVDRELEPKGVRNATSFCSTPLYRISPVTL